MRSSNVNIRFQDETFVVLFSWHSWDGDDCFDDLRVSVTLSDGKSHTYEFGPCAVRSVRKIKLFLQDKSLDSVGGGFRNPDIREYNIHRVGPNLKFVFKYEGSELNHEYVLVNPQATIHEDSDVKK